MRVVLDANVVVSGVCWRGEACRVSSNLRGVRRLLMGRNPHLAETQRNCHLESIRRENPGHNAAQHLNWYLENVKMVDAAPLGKQRSRDAKDDPYLAAALAARANFIVSYDKDLLELKKPFGIEIIRPAQFLKLVKG